MQRIWLKNRHPAGKSGFSADMHEPIELSFICFPASAAAYCLLHVRTDCFAGWGASLGAAPCQQEWAGPGHVEGDVS